MSSLLFESHSHHSKAQGGDQVLNTQWMAEVSLISLVALAAAADAAVRSEVATPDQMLVLWCVIGGMLGSFCSLKFFEVKSRVEAAAQLGVNLVLSGVCSPIIVDVVSMYSGYPTGMRLALPIACALGIVGQQLVSKLIPIGQRFVEKRVKQATGEGAS